MRVCVRASERCRRRRLDKDHSAARERRPRTAESQGQHCVCSFGFCARTESEQHRAQAGGRTLTGAAGGGQRSEDQLAPACRRELNVCAFVCARALCAAAAAASAAGQERTKWKEKKKHTDAYGGWPSEASCAPVAFAACPQRKVRHNNVGSLIHCLALNTTGNNDHDQEAKAAPNWGALFYNFAPNTQSPQLAPSWPTLPCRAARNTIIFLAPS